MVRQQRVPGGVPRASGRCGVRLTLNFRSSPRKRGPRAKLLAVGAALCTAVSAITARADPVADFYRGKTLRMLIGYGPGGGYDIYGRLVAEFLPRHIPGNPTIITQNMQGAGSIV